MSSCELQDTARRTRFVASAAAGVARVFVERPLGPARAASPAAPPQQLEERLAEHFENGRRAGADEVRAELASRIDAALCAVAAAARAHDAEHERWLALLTTRALELAGEIAERIVRRALTRDLELLAPCAEEALAALPAEGVRTLSLHAEDLAALERGAAPALAQLAEKAGLALAADASLARGEATLCAGPSRIELRWDAVVARLRVALESALPLGRVS
jgi:flagellar biosynthesis/type III secretory pathway protein FliH